MSTLSIPVALDPRGNPVPIEEAVRFKTDYYRCPECESFLTPRKGPVRAHYYAHKGGSLKNTNCPLSSQADVERMVDKLRTSDVEEEERDRNIRVYLREIHGSHIEFFGILPALEWVDIERGVDVEKLLSRLLIESSGVNHPPTTANFHPSEPEVFLNIDPSVEEYSVRIDNAEHLEKIQGNWTGDGLSEGDLFIGDQSRARRYTGHRQVKEGEWVYVVTDDTPSSLPENVNVYTIDSYTIIGFPAHEKTKDLLETHSDGFLTDQYGFDADIILPATANPTSEEPIEGQSGDPVLICVTPSEGTDPIFEVVTVPRTENDVVEIEQTGPGNPRYYRTEFPEEGSRRISVHQRNSSRHRLIHLHTEERQPPSETGKSRSEEDQIGLQIDINDDMVFINPLEDQSTITLGTMINPVSLPSRVSYVGPEGLEIEVKAEFSSDSAYGPVTSRVTNTIEEILPEIGHWATQGCEQVTFIFDSLGSVSIAFPTADSEPSPQPSPVQPIQEEGTQ